MRYEIPALVTERLALRPIALTDSDALQVQFSRWDVVKYLSAGMPWPFPSDGAHRLLRDVTLPAVARHEEWTWAITTKLNPVKLIGMISLKTNASENRGYWLGLEWQGRGLMSEACRAAAEYWFDVLGFDVLRESKAMINEPSRRVSEREGMRLVGVEDRNFVSGVLPAGIWEISADEWRARQTGLNQLPAGCAGLCESVG